MSLSINDFIQQVKTEIDFRYNSYVHEKKTKDAAFSQWALELLFPRINTDDAFALLTLENSWGISARYKDDNDGVFALLCAKYSEDSNYKFGSGIAYNLLDTYNTIIEERDQLLDDETVLGEAARALKDGYTISIILVLWGKTNESILSEEIINKYRLAPNQFEIIDIAELRRLYGGLEQLDESSIRIAIKNWTHFDNGPVEAITASVAAQLFINAIKELIPQIYDSNLRMFLGRTKINKQMEETLKDKQKHFWYYNNGVTMLCKSFRIEEDNNILTIEAPRIINGAQTTGALAAFKHDFGDVFLMIRIIASLPGSNQVSLDLDAVEKDSYLQDFCLDIAKYNNSQNPIDVPDYRSNEAVQKRLHERFKELNWFYAHRRGQWDRCTNKGDYRINGEYKLILMENLAQEWFAFDGNPTIAIKEKHALFEGQGHYGNIFMLTRSAETYLIAHLLFSQILARVSLRVKAAKEDSDKVLKEEGRLSMPTKNYLMIGRATKLAAAHMTALMGQAILDRYGILNQQLATKLIPITESEKLISLAYPELEDTFFRYATQLQGEKYKNLFGMLSNKETFAELYDLFKYVIEREKDRGRDILSTEDKT